MQKDLVISGIWFCYIHLESPVIGNVRFVELYAIYVLHPASSMRTPAHIVLECSRVHAIFRSIPNKCVAAYHEHKRGHIAKIHRTQYLSVFSFQECCARAATYNWLSISYIDNDSVLWKPVDNVWHVQHFPTSHCTPTLDYESRSCQSCFSKTQDIWVRVWVQEADRSCSLRTILSFTSKDQNPVYIRRYEKLKRSRGFRSLNHNQQLVRDTSWPGKSESLTLVIQRT